MNTIGPQHPGVNAPVAPQAPTPPPAPAAPAQPAASQHADTFSANPATDYSAIGGTDPRAVVKQDNSVDCGEAAVATIVKQLGGKSAGADPSQLMRDLRRQFAGNRPGTTPDEMVQMLAHEGFSATKSSTNFDQGMADAALANGGRVMVLADSLQLRPGGNAQATGAPHWVVIDGKDAQGNYQISDPSDGSKYGADLAHLAQAMNASWQAHQGGGMLVAQKAPGQSEQGLVDAAAGRSGVMGHSDGIGSNTVRAGQEGN